MNSVRTFLESVVMSPDFSQEFLGWSASQGREVLSGGVLGALQRFFENRDVDEGEIGCCLDFRNWNFFSLYFMFWNQAGGIVKRELVQVAIHKRFPLAYSTPAVEISPWSIFPGSAEYSMKTYRQFRLRLVSLVIPKFDGTGNIRIGFYPLLCREIEGNNDLSQECAHIRLITKEEQEESCSDKYSENIPLCGYREAFVIFMDGRPMYFPVPLAWSRTGEWDASDQQWSPFIARLWCRFTPA